MFATLDKGRAPKWGLLWKARIGSRSSKFFLYELRLTVNGGKNSRAASSEVYPSPLLSTPMGTGVDYVVIGFDMEVQPLVTHISCLHKCRELS